MRRPRKAAETAPTAPTPLPRRDIGPNRETAAEAVTAAAAVLRKFGLTAAIRAFDLAIRELPDSGAAAAIDVADATRIVQMKNRVAQ